MKKVMKIEGMMCPHCSGRVKKALEEQTFVASAEVSHESGTAHVTLTEAASNEILKAVVENAGYKGCFGHSLGHGIGLDVHEAPRVSFGAAEDAVLLPGQVISCEPGIYLEGKYGCRIEDMLAITEQGIHNFTKSPKELIEIV